MRVLRLKAVKEKTGKGHTKIYEEIKAGTFPRPIKIGTRAVGWLEHEIDEYIEAKIAERDSAATA
jgi:prophage regulatory protein